jgi:hypothetical protein
MRSVRFFLVVGTALTLAGCNQYWERKDTVAFGAGDAVAANLAVQVHDPWPAGARDTNIAFDGQRTALAIQRYKTGQVIQPKATSMGGGGGGSAAPAQ